MQKFNEFTENLMKVILVPDESSDAVSSSTPSVEPPDVFTKTAADYLGNFEPPCETQDEAPEITDEAQDEEDCHCSVYHDTNGLKISLQGMDFTFPDSVVDKIKNVLLKSDNSSNEEEPENTEIETEEENTENKNSDEENEENEKEVKENKIFESRKKYGKVNPWAVCTDSVGREDKKKYESCVKKVKSKHKIKK